MNQLEIISSRLSILSDELKNYSKSLEFEEICHFTMDNCTNIPWDNLNSKGLYLIEIKNDSTFSDFSSWVENFRNEWEDPKYKYQFVPNLKQKRIKEHTELKDWIPLYIGKSKKISSRIHQHIYKEIEKTTFALKLNAREHTKKEIFKLSVIKIPSENYDWIVPTLERSLRDRINPIIGKQ